jgi:hypothetical protein
LTSAFIAQFSHDFGANCAKAFIQKSRIKPGNALDKLRFLKLWMGMLANRDQSLSNRIAIPLAKITALGEESE